jgi:hypothetical protein
MDILSRVEQIHEEDTDHCQDNVRPLSQKPEQSREQSQECTQRAEVGGEVGRPRECSISKGGETERNEVTLDGGEGKQDERRGKDSEPKLPGQDPAKLPTKPKPSDFNVPETDEEYNRMVEGMMACGMHFNEAEANIKTRKTAYNRAIREFDRDNKPPVTRKLWERLESRADEKVNNGTKNIDPELLFGY